MVSKHSSLSFSDGRKKLYNPGTRSVAAVPAVRQEIVAAAPHLALAPGPLRAAFVQRTPLGYSLAGDVSRGFYSYPGRGVAYEF